MSNYLKILAVLVFMLAPVVSLTANADEDIEDFIDIVESESKVIAVVKGEKTRSVKLRPGEEITWSGSRGHLGAFFTDDRFLVISTSSGNWRELRLKIDEAETARVSISAYIVLLVTDKRAIGFDAVSNLFVETRLPLDDEVTVVETGDKVAVVITSGKAFGLAANASAFTELRLRIKERIETTKVTANKVTVRTSDRLLSFSASSASWIGHRF